MFLSQALKLAKGFIRLGHDVRTFDYYGALLQASPLKNRITCAIFYKSKVDKILTAQIKNYEPDIIYITFQRVLNADTVRHMRKAAPYAVFVGGDSDLWPKLQKDNRINTAKYLDILTATNNGCFLQDYRNAGTPLCIFMPNMCDPDVEHKYKVPKQWETNILWTGKIEHHADNSEPLRKQLLQKLVKMENCTIYGCYGYPRIGGMNYLYAIGGAKIGVSVNALNSISLHH